MYNLKFIPEVFNDLDSIPDEIVKEIKEYFIKYKTKPHKYSKPLNNQGGLNLRGYRKTYVANATYRIVIKIEDATIKIVEVVAVGQRKNKEVYKNAHLRINKT